jgi:hypothetical protein
MPFRTVEKIGLMETLALRGPLGLGALAWRFIDRAANSVFENKPTLNAGKGESIC